LHRLASAQEDEETSKHNKPTSEEAHKIRVFDPNLVVLSVQLVLSLSQVPLAETVSVKIEHIIGKNLKLARHFAILYLEGHLINYLTQLFVDGVVFD
jgi:hypothetical protein